MVIRRIPVADVTI